MSQSSRRADRWGNRGINVGILNLDTRLRCAASLLGEVFRHWMRRRVLESTASLGVTRKWMRPQPSMNSNFVDGMKQNVLRNLLKLIFCHKNQMCFSSTPNQVFQSVVGTWYWISLKSINIINDQIWVKTKTVSILLFVFKRLSVIMRVLFCANVRVIFVIINNALQL